MHGRQSLLECVCACVRVCVCVWLSIWICTGLSTFLYSLHLWHLEEWNTLSCKRNLYLYFELFTFQMSDNWYFWGRQSKELQSLCSVHGIAVLFCFLCRKYSLGKSFRWQHSYYTFPGWETPRTDCVCWDFDFRQSRDVDSAQELCCWTLHTYCIYMQTR